MSITEEKLALLYDNATLAFANLGEMPSHNPRLMGGYLTLMDKNSGIVECVRRIGECDLINAKKFFAFSLEKAQRLHYHPSHQSSWLSRNVDEEKYQGSIAGFFSSEIVSFSGYDEPEDEVISLMAALGMDSINLEEAKKIAAISSNVLFAEYITKFGHEHNIKL